MKKTPRSLLDLAEKKHREARFFLDEMLKRAYSHEPKDGWEIFDFHLSALLRSRENIN
jgi:hypothetical protein